MKVLLICVGSRGDAEPFCSLADCLVTYGHEVEFFIQTDLESLAPKQNGVKLHLLPFTQQDFYKFVPSPTHGANHENPRVRFVGVVVDVIAELVFPCWNQVLDVARRCQVMVTSALARSLCFALTEKLDISTCLVHLQPLVPTTAFPHYSRTDEFILALASDDTRDDKNKGDYYLKTHWELEQSQHEFLEERLNKLYSMMELKPYLTFAKLQKMLSGNHPRAFIFNAYYKELIPPLADNEEHLGSNIYHVGALADSYIPRDFAPPLDDNLLEFLKVERPVCIGYGSMPYDGKIEMLLEFLQESQVKAILVGKVLQVPKGFENNKNIRQVDSVPYAWLLPQCEMMFCHGGAGVVHATLRAGIPAVISPLMGDQFTYAKLLKAKGLGTQAGATLSTVAIPDLKKAFQEAKDCIFAAREFGKRVRSQDKNKSSGVEGFVRVLEDKVVV